jgi:hypothetical protein
MMIHDSHDHDANDDVGSFSMVSLFVGNPGRLWLASHPHQKVFLHSFQDFARDEILPLERRLFVSLLNENRTNSKATPTSVLCGPLFQTNVDI